MLVPSVFLLKPSQQAAETAACRPGYSGYRQWKADRPSSFSTKMKQAEPLRFHANGRANLHPLLLQHSLVRLAF